MASSQIDMGAAKLVFAGPVGAGKTTAISAIADGMPISTEMPLTDGPLGDKTSTTVAFDFATVMLDDGTPLFVYGLPGQEHFAFMRSIVLEGALGAIVVLDGSDRDIVEKCEHWLIAMRKLATDLPMVIGITKTECAPAFSMTMIRETVRLSGASVPVLTFDARSKEQTIQLVRTLLLSID